MMAIIINLLWILPIVYFIFLRKLESTKKESKLHALLKETGMSFNVNEQWSNNFIGLDSTQKVLVFVKNIDENPAIQTFHLKDLKGCTIISDTRSYKKDNKLETELISLNLELVFLNQKVLVNLYNKQRMLTQNFELKRAEKWKTLIDDLCFKEEVKGLDVSLIPA